MRQHSILILSLCGLLLVSGCSKKRSGQTTTRKEEAKTDKTISELSSRLATPDYKWIRSRGKAHITTSDNEYSANFLMKVRKDSIIYGSANLILEVGRVLLTKDSATMVNFLQHQYASMPTESARQFLGVQGLSLESVQRILLGLPPFAIDPPSCTVSAEGAYYKISRTTNEAKEEMEIDAATMRLKTYSISRNATEALQVQYADYENVSGLMLPKVVRLETPAPNKNVILLSFTSYALTDWDEVRFTVPSGYEKMGLR